jgi:hypothetical protein
VTTLVGAPLGEEPLPDGVGVGAGVGEDEDGRAIVEPEALVAGAATAEPGMTREDWLPLPLTESWWGVSLPVAAVLACEAWEAREACAAPPALWLWLAVEGEEALAVSLALGADPAPLLPWLSWPPAHGVRPDPLCPWAQAGGPPSWFECWSPEEEDEEEATAGEAAWIGAAGGWYAGACAAGAGA